MELVQGTTLQSFFDDPSFATDYPEHKIITIIRSLLETLSYLASQGVVHRDLKPENIIVDDKSGSLKLIDFGLATKIDVPEYIFKICGSPGYIAPEVLSYDKNDTASSYNDRCDVFSAGCIFFNMLFKYPLFDSHGRSTALKQNMDDSFIKGIKNIIMEELNDSESKINHQALNLLQSLLQFNKNKRISASEALNHPYIKPTGNRRSKLSPPKLYLQTSLSKLDDKQYLTSPMSTAGTLNLNENKGTYSNIEESNTSALHSALSPLAIASTVATTPTSAASNLTVFSPCSSKPASSTKDLMSAKALSNRQKCLRANFLPNIKKKEHSPKEQEQSESKQPRRKNVLLPWIKNLFKPNDNRILISSHRNC
jgi:serine/threonine protein kinase